jgi:hypothetical protein
MSPQNGFGRWAYMLWFSLAALCYVVCPVMGHWGPSHSGTKERARAVPIWPKSFRAEVCLALKDVTPMDKNELIDCICRINRTAKAEFLAEFGEEDLAAYLEHLMELDLEDLALCS